MHDMIERATGTNRSRALRDDELEELEQPEAVLLA